MEAPLQANMPEPVRAIAKPELRSPALLSAGGWAGFHPRWRINKKKENKSFLSRPVRLMPLLVNLSAAMKTATCASERRMRLDPMCFSVWCCLCGEEGEGGEGSCVHTGTRCTRHGWVGRRYDGWGCFSVNTNKNVWERECSRCLLNCDWTLNVTNVQNGP